MKYIGSTSNSPAVVDKSSLSKDDLQFRTARYELLNCINEAGHYGCLVRSEDYKGNGVFTHHFYPINVDTLCYEERGEIKLQALYDKTALKPIDLPSITNQAVRVIANDKAETYRVFADLQPKSFVIVTLEELGRIKELDNGSGKVVVKSFGGSGGDGVRIDSAANIMSNTENLPPYPLLAQEFIETADGIPGLVDGRHDVRVCVLNGEPLGGSVRTPQSGGLLSNTHQGGSMRMLDLHELPPELLEFAALIDKRIPDVPRFYTADFMYAASLGRWFLVELNASPGTLSSRLGPVSQRYQARLAAALIDLAC